MVDLGNLVVDGLDGDIERLFVSDCNEVIHFKLVRSREDVDSEDSTFKPEMSHQVFGKTEKIFGYKDLKISLYYTAGWLRTYLNVSYKEKISPSVIGLPADDVVDILTKFLSHDYFENLDLFLNSLNDEPTFKPYGVLIDRITIDNEESSETFEVYHMHVSNTSSTVFDNYYQRLQRFVIWYIDGASYVDVDDDRWHYFVVYEKYTNENNETCYGIVGLSTVYEYYAYPDNIRPRISQLLVLPLFQNCGLAARLLLSMYKFYGSNENVVDITVEDPTDDCQAVRDYVDLCRCEQLNFFTPEKLKEGFTKEIEEELRTKLKIHRKQARRLYEILLLKNINKADEEQYRNYRIAVKNRLYAPFAKTGSTMRRMNKTFQPNEVEEANVFQKPEIRFNTLTKMYNDLEEQYERALKRFEEAGGKLL